MTSTPPRYWSASLTHRGVVRENNEDRVYADDARGIYIVIDGMGGHAAGEHAAEIARDVIKTRLERQTGDTAQRLREAITLANNAIFEAAAANPAWVGMACVLTAVVVEGAQATVGHVGDSRLYQIRRGNIEKVTPDHSPVGEREDRGEISEQEAMRHPRRNEVFRDVGSQPRVPDEPGFIDVLTVAFAAESALLLCSDGLSDSLPAARILAICEKRAGDREACVRELVNAANERGKDNVSVVLVEGENFAASFGRTLRTSTTASAGMDTDRLSGPRARIRKGPLALASLLGMLLGGLLTFAVLQYFPFGAAGPVVHKVIAPQTIASVLAQAKAGDRVHLAPGSYSEDVTLKDGVSLSGEQSIVHGVITGSNVHDLTLSGFTVTRLDLTDSNVTVERCIILGAKQSGVRLRGASAGLLLANEIRDNAGAGVSIEGTSTTAVRNNLIVGNGRGTTTLQPGMRIEATAHPLVKDNTFANNGAEALWLPKSQEKVATQNFVMPAPALKTYRLLPEKIQ